MGPVRLSFFSENGGLGGVRSARFFCVPPALFGGTLQYWEKSPSVLVPPEKVSPKSLTVLSLPENVPLKSLTVLSLPEKVPPKLPDVLPPVKDRKVVFPWVDPAGLSPVLT